MFEYKYANSNLKNKVHMHVNIRMQKSMNDLYSLNISKITKHKKLYFI